MLQSFMRMCDLPLQRHLEESFIFLYFPDSESGRCVYMVLEEERQSK
jgi:hypothetical protein